VWWWWWVVVVVGARRRQQAWARMRVRGRGVGIRVCWGEGCLEDGTFAPSELVGAIGSAVTMQPHVFPMCCTLTPFQAHPSLKFTLGLDLGAHLFTNRPVTQNKHVNS